MANQESSPFSDPDFNHQVGLQYSAATERERADEQLIDELRADMDDLDESYENLVNISREVAAVARDRKLEMTPLYELREKGAVRKFLNNRGKKDLVEATEGWVIVPTSSDVVKKAPGKANLVNGSGLGLVLTKDGKLYGSIARQPLKPVAERLTKTDRADIGRRTFIPKEKTEWYHPPVGEETVLPRYRALGGGVPTLLGDLSDPEGGLNNPYFTPYIIEQCYDALAKFVQENDLASPAAASNDTGQTAETTLVDQKNEPDTELLEEAQEEDVDSNTQAEATQLTEVEGLSDQEKIDQWIDEGLITLHTWLSDNNLGQQHNPGRRINQYMTVYNERSRATKLLETIKKARTPETIRRTLANKGIDELVTVMGTGKKFGEVNLDSPKADEDMVLTTYEVPYNGSGASAETTMDIFLPASDAEEILNMIYENPEMMREIAHRFMDDYLEVGESWDQKRPNYDKLRAKNGGKSRLAIRNNFMAKPDQGVIREF